MFVRAEFRKNRATPWGQIRVTYEIFFILFRQERYVNRPPEKVHHFRKNRAASSNSGGRHEVEPAESETNK